MSSIVTVFPTRVYKFEPTFITDLLDVLCSRLVKSKLSTITPLFHPDGSGQFASSSNKIP